jgi:hypothetical protein
MEEINGLEEQIKIAVDEVKSWPEWMKLEIENKKKDLRIEKSQDEFVDPNLNLNSNENNEDDLFDLLFNL